MSGPGEEFTIPPDIEACAEEMMEVLTRHKLNGVIYVAKFTDLGEGSSSVSGCGMASLPGTGGRCVALMEKALEHSQALADVIAAQIQANAEPPVSGIPKDLN